MVFMRPRVTRTPEQARDLLDEIYHKAPAVKQWDRESQQPRSLIKEGEPE